MLGHWDSQGLGHLCFHNWPLRWKCVVIPKPCCPLLALSSASMAKPQRVLQLEGIRFQPLVFGKLCSSCCWSFSQAHSSTRARCVGAGMRPRASSHAPLLPEPPGTRRCRQTAPKSWVGGQTSELKSLSLLPPSCYRRLWHSGQFSVWLCQGFPWWRAMVFFLLLCVLLEHLPLNGATENRMESPEVAAQTAL